MAKAIGNDNDGGMDIDLVDAREVGVEVDVFGHEVVVVGREVGVGVVGKRGTAHFESADSKPRAPDFVPKVSKKVTGQTPLEHVANGGKSAALQSFEAPGVGRQHAPEFVPMVSGGVTGLEIDEDLRYVLGLEGHRDRHRVETRYSQLCELVNALGHDGKKYRREATQKLEAIVSEVYSAPQVTATAKRFPRLGILSGTALDLTTCDETGQPWDFSVPALRRKAEDLLNRETNFVNRES